MAVVTLGLWSQALVPGKPTVVNPPADIKITNAALGDVIADSNGRTTVKFTYRRPVEPDLEDDEDEGPPSDVPETSFLCSLTPGKIEQCTTDLILDKDEEYIFEVVGKNTIHLAGNYIDQISNDAPPYGDALDSDDESEEGYDLEDVSSDVEMNAGDVSTDASRFEEVMEPAPPKTGKRSREAEGKDDDLADANAKANKKQRKQDGQPVAKEEVVKADEEVSKEDKKKKKKEKKQKQKEERAAAETGAKTETKTTPSERVLPGGLKVLDTKIGTGPTAKKGDTVLMRYIGKLQNGTVFDKNVKGKPFMFRLGQGVVIKGWDEGILGMQVGGERKLVVPPAMAYGKKKMDVIPANSTLIFECKLVEIR